MGAKTLHFLHNIDILAKNVVKLVVLTAPGAKMMYFLHNIDIFQFMEMSHFQKQ